MHELPKSRGFPLQFPHSAQNYVASCYLQIAPSVSMSVNVPRGGRHSTPSGTDWDSL